MQGVARGVDKNCNTIKLNQGTPFVKWISLIWLVMSITNPGLLRVLSITISGPNLMEIWQPLREKGLSHDLRASQDIIVGLAK